MTITLVSRLFWFCCSEWSYCACIIVIIPQMGPNELSSIVTPTVTTANRYFSKLKVPVDSSIQLETVFCDDSEDESDAYIAPSPQLHSSQEPPRPI